MMTMFRVCQCGGETEISEDCVGNSSVMDDRMGLKLFGYDVEVIDYAMVQAACDLDIG
ncbi:UNVERIFIED_CONTAM: hypothetical protein Slati_2907800 [Sesamum latifolium]|uniref:Uncharacterized protein n=1 Tax=Sesamum latifolium TaxID=2727402 RepID=A0AAW2VCH4_9LAMI